MKKRNLVLLILLYISSFQINAQNNLSGDSIYLKRIEVINSVFAGKKEVILNNSFFQFRGLAAIISDAEFIDHLMGHCLDANNTKLLEFKEIFSSIEIAKMKGQILLFTKYPEIQRNLIYSRIKVGKEPSKNSVYITFPLMVNDKAIIYQTDKKTEDVLLILIKRKNQWKLLCRKQMYSAVYN